jgi:hypothetical protein
MAFNRGAWKKPDPLLILEVILVLTPQKPQRGKNCRVGLERPTRFREDIRLIAAFGLSYSFQIRRRIPAKESV